MVEVIYFAHVTGGKEVEIIPINVDRETDKMYYLEAKNPSHIQQLNKAFLGKNIGGGIASFRMFAEDPDTVVEGFEKFRRNRIAFHESDIKQLKEMKTVIR